MKIFANADERPTTAFLVAFCVLFVIYIAEKVISCTTYRIECAKVPPELKRRITERVAEGNRRLRELEETMNLPFEGTEGEGYAIMSLNSGKEYKRILLLPPFPDTHLSPLIQNFAANFMEHNKNYQIDVLIYDGCLTLSEKPIIEQQLLDMEELLNYLANNGGSEVTIIAFGLSCRKVLGLSCRKPELVGRCALINCNFDWFTLNEEYLGHVNKVLGAPLKEFYLRNRAILDAEGTPQLIDKFVSAPTLSTYDEAFYQDFYSFENLEDYYATIFAEPSPESIKNECIIVNNAHNPLVGTLPVAELLKNSRVSFVQLNGSLSHATNEYHDDLIELIISDWLEYVSNVNDTVTPSE